MLNLPTLLPALGLSLLTLGCVHTNMNVSLSLAEHQLTFGAKNYELDGNNDNFSADGRFLCYDTRETFGSGIDRGRTIEKVEIATGRETVLYAPPFSTNALAAPGLGAVAVGFCSIELHARWIDGHQLGRVANASVRAYRDGSLTLGDQHRLAAVGCIVFASVDDLNAAVLPSESIISIE